MSKPPSKALLPPVYQTKTIKETFIVDPDQQGVTRQGLQEILESEFDTSLSMSELSQSDTRNGWDLSWYQDNHFTLHMALFMDPIDISASGKDFSFTKDVIEAQLQRSLELEMAQTKALDGCFVSIKATTSKQAIKFIQIPTKITLRIDSHDRVTSVTLEACPPDNKSAPTKEDMKAALLKLSCRIPVMYREFYRRPDSVERFWVCTIHEENPEDEVLFTSIEFQVQYNEEKIHKRTLIAWKLIHSWMLKTHKLDMDDKELFSARMIAGKQTVAKIEQRVTQPRFYITYKSPSFAALEAMVEILGVSHNIITRIAPKTDSDCPDGFEFKLYCFLFDPKNKVLRPASLQPALKRVFDRVSANTSPESIMRLMFQKQKDSMVGLSLTQIREHDSFINEDAQTTASTIDNLIKEGFLTPSNAIADRFVVAPIRRQWKELRIYFENQTGFNVSHKDLGIWIDQSCGLAPGKSTLSMKCFSLHVSSAYSAMTREYVSPALLEEFMQYRYNQFRIVVNHLNANPYAKRILADKHQVDLEVSNNSQIDPDHRMNPAFWSNWDLLEQFANNVGDSANANIWSFLLLPLEFQQFNYLIISTIPHQDLSGVPAVKRVQPTYHFLSRKLKAQTLSLMYQGGSNGHFTSLLIPNFKGDEFRKLAVTSHNQCYQVLFNKPSNGLWEPIAGIFTDLSLADYTAKNLPKIEIRLPSAHTPNQVVVIASQDGTVATAANLGVQASNQVVVIASQDATVATAANLSVQASNQVVVIASQDEAAATATNSSVQALNEVVMTAPQDRAVTTAAGSSVQVPVDGTVHENDANDDTHGDEAGDIQAAHLSGLEDLSEKSTKKRSTKCDKLVEKVLAATKDIEVLCERSDTLSLIPTPSSPKDLKLHLDQVNSICAQLEECSSSIADRELQTLLRSHESIAAVAEKFKLMRTRITAVTTLRDKLREPPAKQTPKKGKGSKTVPIPPNQKTIDFMLRVKSDFAADDICDQVAGGVTVLLSFLRVIPTPASLVSFYYSVIYASSCEKIRAEMEQIFKFSLSQPTKQLASHLQELTRNSFDTVCDNPMVRGGKTFSEYLQYKHASSWNRIPNDHVLGEMTLCCQVWKLNIALIWRHNNVWRLFVATHGGASPIICLLYARNRSTIQADGVPTLEGSSTCRFFPIDPLTEDWFNNEIFVPSIPNSVQEHEHEPIVSFNAIVHREFALQSEIGVDGEVSADESSVITAELTASQLMDSFVDDDSVSQGEFPTPPEIRAIPLQTIVATVNSAMAIPLRQILTRRRRIIESDDEAETSAPAVVPEQRV
jgi:hypothetical protein